MHGIIIHVPIAEVPPHLKKLVKFIGRAFYQPQQIVVLDILAKYPWYMDLLGYMNHFCSHAQFTYSHTYIRICINAYIV